MTDNIELHLDGKCTITFMVERREGNYVHFSVKFKFKDIEAAFPPIRGCSLSINDIERLAVCAKASLEEHRGEELGPFTAYDAFFSIEFLEGDSVRFMGSYGPKHPFSLGIEGTVSESAMESFQEGWLRQLNEL